MALRQWGVPLPPKGDRVGANVRNLARPFWISTLRHTQFRCLMPVVRFQGWGVKGAKQAHRFSLLWPPILAFLNTEANSLLAPVHPRVMPGRRRKNWWDHIRHQNDSSCQLSGRLMPENPRS